MGSAAGTASGASIGALGLSAASSVIAGEGRADQYRTQAENYRLEGEARSRNYLYEGAARKAEYGIEASRDVFQAERAERAAKFGKVQADLTDATMRDQLTQTLGNIDVIRAAGHADPTSPTTAALKGYESGKSDRQRVAQLVTIRSQVAEDEASADFLRKAGEFALTQGAAAEAMAKYNAGVARDSAARNAAAAESAADTSETLGWINAATSIFGGTASLFGGGSGSNRPRVGPFPG